MNHSELRKICNGKMDRMKAILTSAEADARDLTSDEAREFDRLDNELRAISKLNPTAGLPNKKSEAHDRLSNLEEGLSAIIVNPHAVRNFGVTEAACEEWRDVRTGERISVLRPEQRMSDLITPDYEGFSIGRFIRGLTTSEWKGAELERRAMNEATGGSGLYMIPSPLSAQIIDKARNQSVMFKAGALLVPMDSKTLNMARWAGDPSAGWHSEAAAITASDATLEQVTFTAQTLVSLVQLSVEVMEDAANLDNVVIDALSKVLSIELDRACIRGSGTAPELRGIRNQTGVTVDSTTFGTNGSVISASAPTNAVAWDWLAKQVSALWGVNEYPNAAIYSARTAGSLDLLRATTGAVLPPPGSVANLRLLFTNSIPNNLTGGTSSDCSEAYVGDFSKAMVGMRTNLVVEVSRQGTVGTTSLFSTLQAAIRTYIRGDFQLSRPAAFRCVTGIR
jgi:HK97 family phage major capsid protein